MSLIARSLLVCAGALMLFLGTGAHAQSQAGTGGAGGRSPLDAIFTSDMLGAQVTYLEATTGPAWRVDPGLAPGTQKRTYKFQGCQVMVTASNGTVQALGVNLSPNCTVDLNRFIVRDPKVPSARTMTFGDFDRTVGTGSFASECLEQCGNAYDPSVYDHYVGPQSDNNVEIVASVTLVDQASLDASAKWDTLMDAQSGSDYVQNDSFNCDGKYDAQALGFFKDVRITSILIGTDLPGPWSTCTSSH